MQKYRTRRIDVADHRVKESSLNEAIVRLRDARNTGGPYVIVGSKDGPGPQRTKTDSLDHLRHGLEIAKARDWFDWHPDSGPQFRVLKMLEAMYDNPFRDASVSVSDIDAGVDYCFGGPLYAIGPAVILRRGTPSNTSTFGNDLSAYRLTEGPAAGLVVYTAEHYSVMPGISVGDTVDSSTVLYQGYGSCIEMGWATPDGSSSLAWANGYSEGDCAKLGMSFDALMMALGLPHGHPRGGNAPSGILPAEYKMKWEV